jgi:hypothetical protein
VLIRACIVVALAASWISAILLTYRLARYRADTVQWPDYKPRPLFGLRAFFEESYTPAGKPLVRYLRAAALVASLTFLIGFALFFF